MPYSQKYFSGAAVANTLSAPIGSSDVTIVVSSALVGWPASFPFMAVIDKGTSNEEKVKVSAGTTSLTVTRGQDGTTAVSHTSGASFQHCLDAQTVTNHETFVAGNGTVTPSTSAVGDAASDGVSGLPAAADHKHARESFGVGQTLQVGGANADGVQTTPARSDHIHLGVTSYNGRQGVVTPTQADIKGLFTADGQIFSGTGVGTGEVIDLLAALKEYFAATNQVLVGTGAGTGALQNYVDTTASDIAPIGNVASPVAGAKGIAADAGHAHPFSLFNKSNAIVGSPPLVTAGGYLIQSGYENIVCNSSGQLNVTFPSAFPNGVLSVLLTPNQVDNIGFGSINGTPTKTGFSAGFNTPTGTSPGAVNVVFSWFAIGF